jgi:hypothetical protein
MSTTELIELIEKLPVDKQKEVEAFVLSINSNYAETAENNNSLFAEPQGGNGRGYGSLKGQIWMSDDFNEPLDDFKEYM